VNLLLARRSTGPGGTVGELYLDGAPARFCLTLEQPWNQNRRDDPKTKDVDESSCIPPGTYKVRVRADDRFPFVVELLNVPGRAGILMHNGVDIRHTVGCVLVGQRDAPLATVTRMPYLERSKATLRLLCARLGKGKIHTLEVRGISPAAE